MSKPEWNEDTPKWANWLAQAYWGEWFWYEEKPSCRPGARGWMKKMGTRREFAKKTPLSYSWKDTLERRP